MSKSLRFTCRFSPCDVEGEENDVVELEKSNALLMGPIGFGSFSVIFLAIDFVL